MTRPHTPPPPPPRCAPAGPAGAGPTRNQAGSPDARAAWESGAERRFSLVVDHRNGSPLGQPPWNPWLIRSESPLGSSRRMENGNILERVGFPGETGEHCAATRGSLWRRAATSAKARLCRSDAAGRDESGGQRREARCSESPVGVSCSAAPGRQQGQRRWRVRRVLGAPSSSWRGITGLQARDSMICLVTIPGSGP